MLDPRSFEQLVQSLATQVYGTRFTPYGDGPDGLRDGVVRAPFQFHGQWITRGRLILQVKFRQRPTDAETDTKWAVRQLEKELRALVDGKDQFPEYYVFATNVTPSARAGGGKDRLISALEASKVYGLRDWDLWDYDKLRVLLENNADVRAAFAGKLTPGDRITPPLAEPAFHTTLARFLEKELIGDRFANLEQAGHSVEDAIPLSQVFVDLPSASSPVAGETRGRNFLAGAAALCALPLDEASRSHLAHTWQETLPITDRIVLIGGPGQGKSTLGQYLCQMLRATILQDRPEETLSREGRTAVAQVAQGCAEIGLALPSRSRYPLRVVLSDLAEALAGDDPPESLIAYLAGRISAKAGRTVAPELLERWLTSHPWLLVLDGLDEVPASSNRDDVLEMVTGFWVDVAAPTTDLLVLATTRPQGYNDDFSPKTYHHEHLLPLSPERALEYADRLIPVRYSNEDRQAKVRGRLRRAIATPTTSRLMGTPLQVTMMTALVDQSGRPPRVRWALFNQYYDMVYTREMERSIPAADVLRDRRPDVDAIHRRAALQLQMAGESRSHAEAHLSRAELRALVIQRLCEDNDPGPATDALAAQIVEAAELRLVFLIGAQADAIGFELRSLQEFMAAEALMDGPEQIIPDRLEAIALSPNWRNVFLFAVGNCLVNRRHLRPYVQNICAQLGEDTDDPISAGLLTGSELALEVLEDGGLDDQEKGARLFTRLALRLLRVAVPSLHARLTTIHTAATDAVFREELALYAATDATRLAAVRCLAQLDRAGVPWAAPMLRENWPDDIPTREALVAMPPGTWGKEMRALVLQTVIDLGPKSWGSVHVGWARRYREHLDQSEHIVLTTDGARDHLVDEPYPLHTLAPEQAARLALVLNPLTLLVEDDTDSEALPDVIRFSYDPSTERLADLLEHFADRPEERWRHVVDVAWPLSSCLDAACDADDLRQWATEARAGRLGTPGDWLAAQARWRDQGVRVRDLLASNRRPPIGPDIAVEGFPLGTAAWTIGPADDADAAKELFDIMASLDPGPVRGHIAAILISVAARGSKPFVPLAAVADALTDVPGHTIAPFPMEPETIFCLQGSGNKAEYGAALDRLLSATSLTSGSRGYPDEDWNRYLRPELELLCRDGFSTGAVRLLVWCATSQSTSPLPSTKFDGPRDRAAAALLDGVSGDASAAGAVFGAAWDGEDSLLTVATRLAATADDPSRWAQFSSAAISTLPPTAWKQREQIALLLRDLASRRQSPLVDPDRWRELGLFERPVS